jgi:uncharacterized protein YegP (UPF0339 family)
MKFEVYQGKDKKWYWRAIANNGKIIADGGQGYASKGNVLNAIRSFVRQIKSNEIPIVTAQVG